MKRILPEENMSWQRPILSITNEGTATKGNRYIVGDTPTGTFAGLTTDNIAWYDGTEWQEDIPEEGWITYDLDQQIYIYYINGPSGFEWTELSTGIGADGLVGTKEVDETEIADDKIIVYKTASDKYELQSKPAGSTTIWGWSGSSISQGVNQNRNTSGSFTYQQEVILVHNSPIKLGSIKIDIRISGNYTLTIRNYDTDAVIASKSLTGVSGAEVEFTFATPQILVANQYRIRLASDSGAVGFNDLNSVSTAYRYANWGFIDGIVSSSINYDGNLFSAYTMPFKLVFNYLIWVP